MIPDEWVAKFERDEEQRRALKAKYRAFYDEAQYILFHHDPIGLAAEENTDEYDPEVGTILPRLQEARSPDNLRRIMHEEFMRWFDASTAGPEARYDAPACDLWAAWQRYRANADEGAT